MDFKSASLHAQEQDEQDSLRHIRDQFRIPSGHTRGKVSYLVGHSLGLQPRKVSDDVNRELDRWATLAVRGHFEGEPSWMQFVEEPAFDSARLVGAQREEVTIMNTLTVNLHLLLARFYQPSGKRTKILIERDAFPSDRYVVQSQIQWHGLDPNKEILEIPTVHGRFDMEKTLNRIRSAGDSIALILLGGLNYMSGEVIDFHSITRIGHEHGAIVGFDLAHLVGNVPLNVRDHEFDFAAWCNYKYLNGGPGALGSIFVNRRHLDKGPALTGWWGHHADSRFKMDGQFVPALGADAWHLSTISLLSLIPIRTSLAIFKNIGMTAIREKSVRLTGFLERLLLELEDDRITVITPSDSEKRGAQLSITIRDASVEIRDALRRQDIMVDWREPGIIRAAPAPLYNRFVDVLHFVRVLSQNLG
ncbi:MAG: kynureninase [Saprospiraceae bacterium]|nr:kynureninase [Saprospiraceae bacterium]